MSKKKSRDAQVKRVLKNKIPISVISYTNVIGILLKHLNNNAKKNYGSKNYLSGINKKNGTFEVFELTEEEEKALNLPVEIYF